MNLLHRLTNLEYNKIKVHYKYLKGVSGSHSTAFVFDPTIPQITEGTRVVQLTFTPSKYSKKLIIHCEVHIAELTNVASLSGAALFLNDGTNAIISAGHALQRSDGLDEARLVFTHIIDSTPGKLMTLELRAGLNATGYYFNTVAGSADDNFGETIQSGIVVLEI